jgi:hypothetical protein
MGDWEKILLQGGMALARSKSKTAGRVIDAAVLLDRVHDSMKAAKADMSGTSYADTSKLIFKQAVPESKTVALPMGDSMEFITEWLKRLTSRKFMATVGAAFTAMGACYAAWQTQGIPIGDKIDLTLAAITAVTAVVALYNHTEGQIDKTTIAANANAQAQVAAAVVNATTSPPAEPVRPPELLAPITLDDNGAPGGSE